MIVSCYIFLHYYYYYTVTCLEFKIFSLEILLFSFANFFFRMRKWELQLQEECTKFRYIDMNKKLYIDIEMYI